MKKTIPLPIAITIIVVCAVLTGLLVWQYGFIPEIGLSGPSPTSSGKECVSPGEEMSPEEYNQGTRCCSGLKRIVTSRYVYPCDTPGEGVCDENGCLIPPPTSAFAPWWQCTPCGNGACELEYGENGCNCPEDCGKKAKEISREESLELASQVLQEKCGVTFDNIEKIDWVLEGPASGILPSFCPNITAYKYDKIWKAQKAPASCTPDGRCSTGSILVIVLIGTDGEFTCGYAQDMGAAPGILSLEEVCEVK